MKKCLIVSSVSRQFTLFERGNIEVLKKLGYEIHCVANYSDETEELKELPIIKHNIDIQRSPFSIKNIKAYRQLKKIIGTYKFDLIHCHSPIGGVLARLAARKTRKTNGTKVLYTAHGFHFFKGAPLINWMLYYPIEKYLSKYTDCIITINQEDYGIAKEKFKTKRIELINGIGIDDNKFNCELSEKEKEELRKKIGVNKKDFLCICVGELNKNKNHIMAINAIKNLKNRNINLIIVGKGDLQTSYEKYIKENKIQEQIKLLGYRKDINKLLKISDVLISCSKREGLPVNVLEAMFSDIPVICTNCRGNRDLIKEGINGYKIDIGNIEQLQDRILKIYRKELEFRQVELTKYCKEDIKKKMLKIYDEICRKKVIMLRSTSIKNDSRVIKEAKVLCESKYDVEILGWDRDDFLESNKESIENVNGTINIKVFKKTAQYAAGMKNILKLISFNVWLMRSLKNRKNEISIIHSCDLDTAIPAIIISKIYKKKLVYDIFDYYIDSHYVPNKLKKLVEKIEISIINKADLTIICTEQRKKQIKKSNPKKCIVIYNTPEIFKNIDKSEVIKSNSKRVKIVYVGILQENRLLEEIGREITKYKNVELHIGGFGKLEDYFLELSKKCENVFFYGKMRYKDVLALEKDCDILFATYNPIIENHKYSAPNKLYEAMALSKPIIVCKHTGIDKIVNEEGMGLSISYNSEQFIESIKELEKNEKLRKKMGDNAFKAYNDKYSWKQMKIMLIHEYNNLEENKNIYNKRRI